MKNTKIKSALKLIEQLNGSVTPLKRLRYASWKQAITSTRRDRAIKFATFDKKLKKKSSSLKDHS